MTKDVLRLRQNLPLEVKVKMTERRIEQFVEYYGLEGVYVSFSGGKDSTVLCDIARRLFPDIKLVYLDTWFEMPQVRRFVYDNYDVEVIKPEIRPKDLIEQFGWCFPSKDVAQMIEAVRRDRPWAIKKMNGLDGDGKYSEYRQQYKKWSVVVDWDVIISTGCCDQQKELPVADYEKRTGRHPILGLMAAESNRRTNALLTTGCNAFDYRLSKDEETGRYVQTKVERPTSNPMGFWTQNDVLAYIYTRKLPIADPYGEVYLQGSVRGQVMLYDLPVAGFMQRTCKFCNSGEKRTGCYCCPIGCHLDNFSKLQNLKKRNKKLYDYVMEELGQKKLVELIQRDIL